MWSPTLQDVLLLSGSVLPLMHNCHLGSPLIDLPAHAREFLTRCPLRINFKQFPFPQVLDIVSVMAEIRAGFLEDASVTRHGKRTQPSSDDDNCKAEVLRRLQGGIHFEKILPPTSVGMEYVLALPLWFIEKHGDKLGMSVILRSESSTTAWNVNLNANYIGNSPQVKLSGGWRAFARSNNLSVGDSLIFSLKATSEFEVYVFRRMAGNPKRFQRTRSRACRGERLAAAGKFKGLATNKMMRESSVSASGPSATSSDSIDLHLLKSENFQDASTGGHRDSHNGHEPAIELDMATRWLDPAQRIGETMKKGKGVQGKSAPVKTIKKSQLPGFSKKLTFSNFCQRATRSNRRAVSCLEIPSEFWKTYSNRIRSVVKLQGIREESPVRTVACSLTSQAQTQDWRLYLRAGWSDFRDENNLQVGQELEFTLSADSFFVVRRVNS